MRKFVLYLAFSFSVFVTKGQTINIGSLKKLLSNKDYHHWIICAENNSLAYSNLDSFSFAYPDTIKLYSEGDTLLHICGKHSIIWSFINSSKMLMYKKEKHSITTTEYFNRKNSFKARFKENEGAVFIRLKNKESIFNFRVLDCTENIVENHKGFSMTLIKE
jgi:hypothetical protein